MFGLVRKSRLDDMTADRDYFRNMYDAEFKRNMNAVQRIGKLEELSQKLQEENSELATANSNLGIQVNNLLAKEVDFKRDVENLRDRLLATEQERDMARRKVSELSNAKHDEFITVRNYLARNMVHFDPSYGLLQSIGKRAAKAARKLGIEPGRHRMKDRDYGSYTYPKSIVAEAANPHM